MKAKLIITILGKNKTAIRQYAEEIEEKVKRLDNQSIHEAYMSDCALDIGQAPTFIGGRKVTYHGRLRAGQVLGED
jgi:hypothetical protein